MRQNILLRLVPVLTGFNSFELEVGNKSITTTRYRYMELHLRNNTIRITISQIFYSDKYNHANF